MSATRELFHMLGCSVDFRQDTFWRSLSWSGVVFLGVYFLSCYLYHGLHRYPGPFFANFTDLWRLLDVWRRDHHSTVMNLHKRMGPTVRLGPNYLSISDPGSIAAVYTGKTVFLKSNYYHLHDATQGFHRIVNLFSDLDSRRHAENKRPIAGLYSMTNLQNYEIFVDDTIIRLFTKWQSRSGPSGKLSFSLDLGEWLQFYAFDVIAEITFGKALGFIEQGTDVANIVAKLDARQDYMSVIGQMPWLDHFLLRNPLLRLFDRQADMFAKYCREIIQNRLSGNDNWSSDRPDFLSRFLQLKQDPSSKLKNDDQILGYMMMNILAGSDTTAVTLRAIFYYLVKTPTALKKLVQETDSHRSPNEHRPVSWQSSQQRPYLEAVIKESFRIHPAVGLGLERVVPACGLTLPDGYKVPPGTIVGANPWVVHRDESVFGKDTDQFDPDRWLQRNEESMELFNDRRNRMNATLLHFGKGSRTCIGKNISLLEVYKVVPSILQKFDLSLATPDKEWEIMNSFFVRQQGLDVRMTPRMPS